MVHLKIPQMQEIRDSFWFLWTGRSTYRTRAAFLLFLILIKLRLTKVHRPHLHQSCAASAAGTASAAAAALGRPGVSGRYLQLHGATGGKIKINRGALK